MLNYIWIIPLLPVAGTLVNGVVGLAFRARGRRLGKTFVAAVAVGVCLAAFAYSLIAILQLPSVPGHLYKKDLFTWIPGMAVKTGDGTLAKFEIPWGVQLDPLSAVMILVVTGVGSLIHIYAVGYMWDDDGFYRFFAYLNLFMFAMLTLVLAGNYLLMFVGWEGVGLCSYLLIGFYLDRKSAGDAAKKAFVVNRVG
ncbi:MAG TPA: proton-conducting transporter membrane subunit, partial [Acidobacteriota bacterium]